MSRLQYIVDRHFKETPPDEVVENVERLIADNWRTCPNCLRKGFNVEEMYGKVSAAEYAALLQQKSTVRLKSSLREDYQVWTDDKGIFHVDYGCSCEVCGFKYVYKVEKNALSGPEATIDILESSRGSCVTS